MKAKQQAMLDTVRAMGNSGWISRADIAAYLNKTRLNPGEVALLELLAEQGLLDRQIVPGRVEHISMIVYRVVTQEAKHEQSDSRARQKA